jgi:hypothetical protein
MKTTKKGQKKNCPHGQLRKTSHFGPGPVSVWHEGCGTQGPGCNTLLLGGNACCAKKTRWAGLVHWQAQVYRESSSVWR